MHAKFKFILLFVVLSTTTHLYSFGCCAYNPHPISIYPFKDTICTKSIFILSININDFNFLDSLKNIEFIATNSTGKTTSLKIEKLYTGIGYQIILRPTKKLSKNDIISIKLISTNLKNIDTSAFAEINEIIQNKKWIVGYNKAERVPQWSEKDSLTYRIDDHRASSAPGYGVEISIPLIYNSKNRTNQFPIEIKYNGVHLIAYLQNGKLSLYNSICGANFFCEVGKVHNLKIRIFNSSGSYFTKIKEVSFFAKSINDGSAIILEDRH